MRARSVALDCGARRSVIGAFDLTPDGDLVLLDRAICAPVEGGTDAARMPPPQWATTGPVVVAPPAHRSLIKSVAVPPVKGEQRVQVIRFEAEQIVGGAWGEVVWDHVPAAAGAAEREMLAVMKLSVGEELCAGIERCGLVVDRIVPTGWALVHALRHNYPELKGPAVVVWIDGSTALLVRVEGAEVGMHLVGLPGMVRAPVHELALPKLGEAETEAAEPPSVPWLDRVAVEIARLLGGEGSGGAGQGEAEVFLGGDDGAGEQAVAGLAVRAAVRVNSFDALRRVRLGARASGSDTAAAQMGVVVGLALAARDQPGINLLPPARQRDNRFRGARGRWLVGAGAVVATLVVLMVWLRQERLGLLREGAVVAARLVPQRVAETAQREGERARAQLRQQLDALAAIRAARTGWLEWMADLQERLGTVEDVWLDSLEVRPSAATGGGSGGSVGGAEAPAEALRVAVTGRVLRRAGADPLGRVRRLRESLLASRFVAAVEEEKFDDTQPGLLRFGCTLVMKTEAPL